MKSWNKFRGCLIGGAAGDALGYAVEFKTEDMIYAIYGEEGITEYRLIGGKARISDDTQMTLFTANGLISAGSKDDAIICIYENYLDWLETQRGDRAAPKRSSRLLDIPELWSDRAPGGTCLDSLESGEMGTIDNPLNDSKGCGGIMRAAPVGLYAYSKLTPAESDMLGSAAAAITHSHELGYIPTAMLVHIIRMIMENDDISLREAVRASSCAVKKLFPNAEHMEELLELIEKAETLSEEDIDDIDAIHQLGGGWVAEETLAIAVYCALKYENDFDRAVIAAVNHSGDSDSTGAVCGNILGAYLGLDAIPEKYLKDLELKDIILRTADELFIIE
ncbi:MAG: ADP-ribosylglycohydrolase family protein [Oscillospiraceae bacterium]